MQDTYVPMRPLIYLPAVKRESAAIGSPASNADDRKSEPRDKKQDNEPSDA